MMSPENAKERMFCPRCGRDGARDVTGENDWFCASHGKPDDCGASFISPLRERDLQGKELIRLRLENEQLRIALQAALK
jgi:hypothetical protein